VHAERTHCEGRRLASRGLVRWYACNRRLRNAVYSARPNSGRFVASPGQRRTKCAKHDSFVVAQVHELLARVILLMLGSESRIVARWSRRGNSCIEIRHPRSPRSRSAIDCSTAPAPSSRVELCTTPHSQAERALRVVEVETSGDAVAVEFTRGVGSLLMRARYAQPWNTPS
jgi:hypothetical protein